ncbi:hypothetical protein GCM10007858_35290 [Bradyrhizobium liaoningense]|nr:hypothetical protein GCM10007858_35290 [Bradyrhizobium liaoningense]
MAGGALTPVVMVGKAPVCEAAPKMREQTRRSPLSVSSPGKLAYCREKDSIDPAFPTSEQLPSLSSSQLSSCYTPGRGLSGEPVSLTNCIN